MQYKRRKNRILALALAGILATAAPALAEKPSWAGGGKKDTKHEQGKKHESGKKESHKGHDDYQGGGSHIYFGDQHRTVIRSYYSEQYRSGHCPPGLAKKNNGCMPPGQARKWAMGRPLPPDVVYYDLPPEIIVQLGAPPPNHRFVRVAGDILMIAVGTGMVVDAIQDLSNY
ncbi:MAG: RcnB family protein [Thermodesulfobacteriota bacterium]